MCNVGNLRNTWKSFDDALIGNNIVSKIDFVYSIKNGIERDQEFAIDNFRER